MPEVPSEGSLDVGETAPADEDACPERAVGPLLEQAAATSPIGNTNADRTPMSLLPRLFKKSSSPPETPA